VPRVILGTLVTSICLAAALTGQALAAADNFGHFIQRQEID